MKLLGLKRLGLGLLGAMFLMSSLMPGFSDQLNKLPALVNHYRHHVEEHGTDSFASFIDMHYNNDSSHRTEENHQDLPLFQLSSSNTLAFVEEATPIKLEIPESRFLEHADFKHALYSFIHPGSIFQPPRFS